MFAAAQTVREVRFDPTDPGERYRDRVALQLGQPFDANAVRESIARLYATGRFAEIEVDSSAGTVTFRTKPNYFIGAVTASGLKDNPTPVQAVNTAKLQLGDLYSDTKRDQAVAAITRLLQLNGFHQVKVDAKLTQHDNSKQVDLDFVIEPGRRARIGALQWQGDPGFPAVKLAAKAGLKVGQLATAKRITEAVQNLRKFYQDQQLLSAQVENTGRVYDAKAQTEQLAFRVIQGPRIVVDAPGSGLSQKKLRSILPIYEEGAADADLVKEGARDLREYLQAQGYFEADVQGGIQDDLRNGVINIHYEVDRGDRHRLDRLEITGNHFFDTATLLERMTITPKSASGRGRFSRGLLDQDINNLKELYRSNGFREVAIKQEVEDNYLDKPGLIHLKLNITEGPQTLVGELHFEGNQQIPAEELLGLVTMQSGQAFSEQNASLDRDAVLAHYYDNGFPAAHFDWYALPGISANRVNLVYTLDEGHRESLDRLYIAGQQRTRLRIIEKQIEMQPGKPLSQTERLETQRRLYDLGVFNRVDLAVQNPDGDEDRRTMLLQLEEAGRWTLAYGFGAEVAKIGGGTVTLDSPEGAARVSPRVSFDATRRDVFGEAHTLAFKSLVSTVEQRGSLTYTAPRILDNPKLTLYLNGLADRSDDVRTFTQLRFEGSIALAWKRNRTDTLIYRLGYHRVKEYNLKIDPKIIPTASLPVSVGIPSITFIRDRRDNPADSHRGIFLSVDAGVSTGWLGSEANFTHLYMQQTSYHPIGKDIVLARNTIFGVQEPYGGLRTEAVTNTDGTPGIVHTREIPLAEAFFSGGPNSNRAFNVNQAGPRDPVTGFPLGGNAVLMNSVELRFPLRKPNVGGVVFYDAGNVYDKVGDISFRLHQRDDKDFGYMVHAAGFGVRYKTPIGPVRVDLAWTFNPPAYQGVNGTLSDLLSSRIPLTPVARRLSHIQFFFSIGQTY